MKHIWLWLRKCDLEIEHHQANDEGKNTASLNAEFKRLTAPEIEEDVRFQEQVGALLDKTDALPVRPDYPFNEPSDLAGIRTQRPEGPRTLELKHDSDAVLDRIHGAWLGRCAGCLLGKPLEGKKTTDLWPLLKAAGKSMLDDYVWKLSGAEKLNIDVAALNKLRHMPEDDDTNYTVTGLAIVDGAGMGFTAETVADFWMNNIPLLHTCTAERVAYRNLTNEVPPPRSASYRNPYREWIGAQIRADFFGYVAPGNPELAAELAWRDACISHVKNGIYGEMWVAAMLAAAVVEKDPLRIIEVGLSEVPQRSRLAEAIRDVIGWFADGKSYADVVALVHQRWDENNPHHWCHVISNAQIVAVGLLWSEKNYETAITRAVYPCFDTDCNGATVGSIMGMSLGAKALPSKWTAVLNDTIQSGVVGYHTARISELAAKTLEISRRT